MSRGGGARACGEKWKRGSLVSRLLACVIFKHSYVVSSLDEHRSISPRPALADRVLQRCASDSAAPIAVSGVSQEE